MIYAELEALVASLVEALEFYAERRNYREPSPSRTGQSPAGGWMEFNDSFDKKGAGARARAALAKAKASPAGDGG